MKTESVSESAFAELAEVTGARDVRHLRMRDRAITDYNRARVIEVREDNRKDKWARTHKS